MLPSIRALAKDLRISVITTKRAYDELEHEGLICTVAGKDASSPHAIKNGFRKNSCGRSRSICRRYRCWRRRRASAEKSVRHAAHAE